VKNSKVQDVLEKARTINQTKSEVLDQQFREAIEERRKKINPELFSDKPIKVK